jgi:hypothetical protein
MIKKPRSIISILLLTVLIWLGVNTSCTKIDTPPMLEITVKDDNGQTVEGIAVGLFDDIDEWSMLENPVQAWKITDITGKVLFRDLMEDIYYFYADGDSINNIGRDIMLSDPLKINEIRQITIVVE